MKNRSLQLLILSLGLWPALALYPDSAQGSLLANKLHEPAKKKNRKPQIPFIFNNEDLIDIINMLAGHKEVNVVLPTGAHAIKVKVTIAIPQKLTLNEAWDILYTILDIAGYSLEHRKDKGSDFYIIVKNGQNITRDPFPVYINTPIDELPDTDERIRYMYYLKNIKVSQEFNSQLNQLFKELMPEGSILKADKASNGILLVGKSQDIKSFIRIAESLDDTDFKESFDVIHLSYTQAPTIAKMFNEGILKSQQPPQRYHLDARKQEEGNYFAGNIKIIPYQRSNTLVALGRPTAIERVKEFIFKYIDVEMDSGKSILHVYELQYLDATDFAPVLDKVVKSASTGGTEQSKAGEARPGGPERFFDQVVIQADTPPEASGEEDVGKYSGGNKIVVAARNDDWKRIKKIIEQLDIPQPQVIIEVLIADLSLEDARSLGAISRNPADIPFPGTSSVQAAMVDQVVLDKINTDANPNAVDSLTGVNSDLNAITVPISLSDPTLVSIPKKLFAGTAVISISDKDGRTWSILEILKSFRSIKILSHPHIIATNNKEASIKVGETRLVVDQAAPSTSGITLRKKNLEANTNVFITPRISSANTVNLQVKIDIDQFNDPTNFQGGGRINRDIITNATIKSGDILALGGLIIETTQDQVTRTPLLSDIPILGWLFKRRNKEVRQTSIIVFISPTIVQPKLRGGMGKYTERYINVAETHARQSGLFDNLRDPITRWFFRGKGEGADIAYGFLERGKEKEVYDYEKDIDYTTPPDPNLVDTTAPLKDFLVDEENPLEKRKEPIKAAVRIKETERPAHTKKTTTSSASSAPCKQQTTSQPRNKIAPDKQRIKKTGAITRAQEGSKSATSPVQEKLPEAPTPSSKPESHTLSDLLKEGNPLL